MPRQKIIPKRGARLESLGTGYLDRYRRAGSLVDLETAIRRYQEALDATPDDYPDRGDRLQSLGICHRDRYDRIWITGRPRDSNPTVSRSYSMPRQKIIPIRERDYNLLELDIVEHLTERGH